MGSEWSSRSGDLGIRGGRALGLRMRLRGRVVERALRLGVMVVQADGKNALTGLQEDLRRIGLTSYDRDGSKIVRIALLESDGNGLSMRDTWISYCAVFAVN